MEEPRRQGAPLVGARVSVRVRVRVIVLQGKG